LSQNGDRLTQGQNQNNYKDEYIKKEKQDQNIPQLCLPPLPHTAPSAHTLGNYEKERLWHPQFLFLPIILSVSKSWQAGGGNGGPFSGRPFRFFPESNTGKTVFENIGVEIANTFLENISIEI
jgi:hypothetical protein